MTDNLHDMQDAFDDMGTTPDDSWPDYHVTMTLGEGGPEHTRWASSIRLFELQRLWLEYATPIVFTRCLRDDGSAYNNPNPDEEGDDQ